MQRMANVDDWVRNLHDLGCSEEITMQVVNYVQVNDMNGATELLRRHKKILLEELHNSENKVDLLDFLLYQLKKAKK